MLAFHNNTEIRLLHTSNSEGVMKPARHLP